MPWRFVLGGAKSENGVSADPGQVRGVTSHAGCDGPSAASTCLCQSADLLLEFVGHAISKV